MLQVILADPDLMYAEGIRNMLLMQFGSQTETEIITDRLYFRSLAPGKAGEKLLVISSSFVPDHQTDVHICPNRIILEEGPGKVFERDQSGALHISKYHDPETVRQAVSRAVKASLFSDLGERISAKVIAVVSASGGVGKTMLSLGLCSALKNIGKKAVYLDAEYLQTFGCRLEGEAHLESPELYARLAGQQRPDFDDVMKAVRKEPFDHLPPFKRPLISMNRDLKVFSEIIDALRSREYYEYIVVDTGNDLSSEKAELISRADLVMIVTRPEREFMYADRLFEDVIEEFGSGQYMRICNMADPDSFWQFFSDAPDPRIYYPVGRWENGGDLTAEAAGKKKEIMKLCLTL